MTNWKEGRSEEEIKQWEKGTEEIKQWVKEESKKEEELRLAIKDAREAKKTTYEKIGKVIKTTKATALKKCRGEIRFSIWEMEKIEEYLEVSVKETSRDKIIKEIIKEIEKELEELSKKYWEEEDGRSKGLIERTKCMKKDAIRELKKRLKGGE